MRLMQYRLELEEDEGYVISNAPPMLGGSSITPKQLREPGIRMSLESATPSPDRIFEQFKFNEANWENPPFRSCYQQTLRGAETGWKLVSVEVMFGYLSLEFVNENRYQELEENGDCDDESPYYNENVSFAPDNQGYARLRFEVACADGSGCEIYQVEISHTQTKVTEFIGHQKRIINFLPPIVSTNGDGKNQRWIKVTSYCG